MRALLITIDNVDEKENEKKKDEKREMLHRGICRREVIASEAKKH